MCSTLSTRTTVESLVSRWEHFKFNWFNAHKRKNRLKMSISREIEKKVHNSSAFSERLLSVTERQEHSVNGPHSNQNKLQLIYYIKFSPDNPLHNHHHFGIRISCLCRWFSASCLLLFHSLYLSLSSHFTVSETMIPFTQHTNSLCCFVSNHWVFTARIIGHICWECFHLYVRVFCSVVLSMCAQNSRLE